MIVLVGTPIGNLGDISRRAVDALASADLVAAEDTRRARALLSHLGLRKRLVSYHRGNERTRGPELVAKAGRGTKVVLVADAGMPGVSDPGEALVRRALAEGVDVEVVPGPSAALTALVVSGLRTDRFAFEGFLPRRGRERKERLQEVANDPRTAVIFEAPLRVAATLADLAEVCGQSRRVAVARELTKLYETVWRGVLGEAVAAVGEPRGEYVIVLEGASHAVPERDVPGLVAERVAEGTSTRDAIVEVSRATGIARSTVYRKWLESGSTGATPRGKTPKP